MSRPYRRVGRNEWRHDRSRDTWRTVTGVLSLATVLGLFSIFDGTSALSLPFQARKLDSAARRLVDSTA
jgi:hypothetical protein